jgi:hypothetical protein
MFLRAGIRASTPVAEFGLTRGTCHVHASFRLLNVHGTISAWTLLHLSLLSELFELFMEYILTDVSKHTIGVTSCAKAFVADLAVQLIFIDITLALAVGRGTLFQTTFLQH